MKEINATFSFGRAKNAQHHRVHADILGYITADFAEAHSFAPLHTTYSDLFAIECGIFGSNTAFWETAEIAALDEERDRDHLFITHTIATAFYSPDADTRAAAERLSFVSEPFKRAYEKDYDSNTSLVEQFIAVLRKEENADAVEKLNLSASINALEAVNNQFKTVYEARYREYQARITTETMKTIRPKVDVAAHEVFKAINALYMVNELTTKDAEKKAALEAVIDDVNARLSWLEKTLDGTASGGTDNAPSDGEETGGDDTTPETPDEPEEDRPVVQ